jgi:serine/threonine protein kinase
MIVQNMEIYEQIGKGEFATVYRGRHRDIAETVAIKAIPMQRLHINPPLKRMIEAEQKALSMAKHENIIKLHTIIQTDREVDLIYEYCEQGSLSSLLSTHQFTESQALQIIYDLCSALVCLKAHNIVHRDIKPENVLVKNGRVKLADFGLCMVGPPSPADCITHIGSMAFMSPEAIERFIYDTKTDTYSLGLLGYEILGGKLPFSSRDPSVLLEEKRRFIISKANLPYVSEDFIYVLDRMTKFDPRERIGVEQALFECGRIMQNQSIPRYPLRPNK